MSLDSPLNKIFYDWDNPGMKALLPCLMVLALAACNTTVSKEEAAGVEYGPKPAHWKEDMPYAMFFDRVQNGLKTGLAIHAAPGAERARLGTRASAGCVRLAPENARTLFELIQREYAGLVPRFAPEEHPDSSLPTAKLVRDGRGQLKLADGYEVLVVIEENRGESTVAALF